MTRSRLRNWALIAAAFLVLFGAGGPAVAQTVPFQVTGAGVVDYIPLTVGDPVYHWAAGEATGLGRYFGEGRVQLDQFTGATTAEFSSAKPFVFTGADGDQLVFTYGDTDNGAAGPGEVELVYVGNGEFITVWLAEFNPVPGQCTGRFANVVGGSFLMLAVTGPFVPGATDPVEYSWEGRGTLEFKRK